MLDPSSNSVSGTVRVDVHYYEDGNVRMNTSKNVDIGSASSADAVVKEISKAENKYQEELNRAFTALAEGSFKGLRRQLPVTRQRVEWEKIGGYRVRITCDPSAVIVSNLMAVAWPGCRRWQAKVAFLSRKEGRDLFEHNKAQWPGGVSLTM